MNKNQIKFFLFIVGFVLFIILIFLGYWFILSDFNINHNLRVVFLDIGQGDSILIQVGNKNILVDGGFEKSVVHKLDKYIPIYNRKLDLIILTHFGADHINGLIDVLQRYKVDYIIDNGLEDSSLVYFYWKELIQDKNIKYIVVNNPLTVDLSQEVKIDFIWPVYESIKHMQGSENFTSIVFKLVYDNISFLFTGDATKEVEQELVKTDINLKANVLKVGHHGSKYSSIKEFLQKVEPEYSVICVGKDNKFNHPSLRVLKNLENVNTNILRTDKNGDIIFTTNGKKLKLQNIWKEH